MATVDPLKVEVEILHEWQLCPKCNGEGIYKRLKDVTIAHLEDKFENAGCDLCNGKKIISKVNGLPPD